MPCPTMWLFRQALTDEDKAGREQFMAWCREIGCEVRLDAIGNIFARRAGSDNTLPPVITGSHLDTQQYLWKVQCRFAG